MMTIDEQIAILQAYKEGKTIEYKHQSGSVWYGTIDPEMDILPLFNFGDFDYRIKSEPGFRKFNSPEELLQALSAHGYYLKEGNTYRFLKKFTALENGDIVYSLSGWTSTTVRTWEEISSKVTFADGTQFGIID